MEGFLFVVAFVETIALGAIGIRAWGRRAAAPAATPPVPATPPAAAATPPASSAKKPAAHARHRSGK